MARRVSPDRRSSSTARKKEADFASDGPHAPFAPDCPGFPPDPSSMSNILKQDWLLSRRHMLRGLGATIALPMLDCMRPLRAAAAAVTKPKRSVFIYIPNGVNVLTWQI